MIMSFMNIIQMSYDEHGQIVESPDSFYRKITDAINGRYIVEDIPEIAGDAALAGTVIHTIIIPAGNLFICDEITLFKYGTQAGLIQLVDSIGGIPGIVNIYQTSRADDDIYEISRKSPVVIIDNRLGVAPLQFLVFAPPFIEGIVVNNLITEFWCGKVSYYLI